MSVLVFIDFEVKKKKKVPSMNEQKKKTYRSINYRLLMSYIHNKYKINRV